MRIIASEVDRATGTQMRAVLFGYLGVIPFAFAALLVWLPQGLVAPLFLADYVLWAAGYGAVILSFMAGARWGAAIRDWRPDKLFGPCLAALISWITLIPNSMLPGLGMSISMRIAILMAAFIILLAFELSSKSEWGPWYRTLRVRLTLATCAFLLITVLGLTQ